MELSLPETLRRLRTHAEEPGPDSRELAARTALPEDTVRALLRGPGVPPGTVEERVCARIRTLAAAPGREAFFTAPPADTLNRVLRARPARRGQPAPDPFRDETQGYAVAGADPRRDGAVAPEWLEQLHAGLIRSGLPTREGTQQR